MNDLEILSERLLQLANDEGTAQIHDVAIEIARLAPLYRRKIADLEKENKEYDAMLATGVIPESLLHRFR